jgi:hypothetical protein
MDHTTATAEHLYIASFRGYLSHQTALQAEIPKAQLCTDRWVITAITNFQLTPSQRGASSSTTHSTTHSHLVFPA